MSFAPAARLPVPVTVTAAASTRRSRLSAAQPAGHAFRRSQRSVVIRASGESTGVDDLKKFREKLREDLASKETEWKKEANVSGGVGSGGIDIPQAAAAPVAGAPDIIQLQQDNFYDTLAAAGDSLVVVDFYTDWCGPCKLIYPTLCAFQLTYPKVKFYKFNCNKDNKELGKKLGIRVAPTFHLYRKSEQLAVMTGAKTDQLEALIKEHM